MGILAVILGILAVVCALVATFLFGTVGGVVAGVLGAGAAALSYLKAKKDGKGGKAGIAIGALAIILAFTLTDTWSKAFTELHNKALKYKPDGLWAQASEDTHSGLVGIITKLPMNDASMNALVEEMTELNKVTDAQK